MAVPNWENTFQDGQTFAPKVIDRLKQLATGSTGVASVSAGDSSITVGGTATDPTIAVNAIAESNVTNLVTDLAGKQTLDSDLTAIAALDASTSGAIASDGAGWIKKTYAQFKTALSLTSTDVGLGSVTNDAQLKAANLDTDNTLAANSDTKIASQKAVKFFATSRDQLARTARGVLSETWPWPTATVTATAFGGTGASSAVAGTLLGLRAGDVVTNLQCFCIAAGSSVTLFKLALYKTDGTFLGATASLHASLAANSFMTGAISGGAVTIAADGGYYVAGLAIASVTAPTFARTASQTGGSAAIGTGVKSYISVASQSDLTGNITPAAATTVFWFACN